MRITVASGKGGTGKTTVAASLARALSRVRGDVTYADFDVEEPNGEVFLDPAITEIRGVDVSVPAIDPGRCTLCGDCARACQFHALAVVRSGVVTFPELCHGCGACGLACPVGAITEKTRPIGTLRLGSSGELGFIAGELNIGEASATPLIRAVKGALPRRQLVIADSPPGTACPAVETLRGSDHVILVTEPTPFGLYDLKLAVATCRKLGVATGVVINRCDIGDQSARNYCRGEELAIHAEIPNSRDVAESYARGELPLDAVPAFGEAVRELAQTILTLERRDKDASGGSD